MTSTGDVEPLAFAFDADHPEDHARLADLLGGKGAGLARMTAMGLPVPPGFTLTTRACERYLDTGWDEDLEEALQIGLAGLEVSSRKRLGGCDQPLLVSVRSGAAVSMPGMMDTALNVGMTDDVEAALARLTGDAAFAADTHRRALLGFASVVCCVPAPVLVEAERATTAAEIRALLSRHGAEVPVDPAAQVAAAVRAVFASCTSDRARTFREVEGLGDDLLTAATVQAMVFGNLGDDSGTGVAFSRDPSTGSYGLMGDFLRSAQGEDVVAGDHATMPLQAMASAWPDAWAELGRIAEVLEHEYADMVDIEFTVERGRLWMLQARQGKRSPMAALRAAVEMADDPDFPVDRADAVQRCLPYLADPPMITQSTDDRAAPEIATGLAASPGRAIGVLCLDPDEAVRLKALGVDVVLVRRETSPSDVHGMAAASGLVTTLGGLVSHAAVVARSWGKPAVVGADGLHISGDGVRGGGLHAEVGELVTVDGDAGRLLLGGHASTGRLPDEVVQLRRWQAAASAVVDSLDASPQGARMSEEEVDFSTLHALRVKGMAPPTTLAAMTSTDESVVLRRLQQLVAAGLASHIDSRDLWRLTPAGSAAHQEALDDRALDTSMVPYDRFLDLNDSMKQLCTDWQLRDGAANDHTDQAYDARIVERLHELDADAQSLLGTFPESVRWMRAYGPRLASALSRFAAGDGTALTGVMCDSYHDVWMELHEDLIIVQGIDRVAEGSG